MNRTQLARLIGLGLLPVLPSLGALITSANQIGTPQTVIDFSQFAGANTISTPGPISVGSGVNFSSTNPDGSVLGSGPYSFNDNGSWDASVSLAGLDVDQFGGDTYTMKFTFANPVSAVGGFLNYAAFAASGFSDATIAIFDKNGNMLGIADVTKDHPVTNQTGEFLGFADNQADIASFSLSNSAIALQNLTFSGTASPEPATAALWSLSTLLLICVQMGRRR
jgi:hypothetical protein